MLSSGVSPDCSCIMEITHRTAGGQHAFLLEKAVLAWPGSFASTGETWRSIRDLHSSDWSRVFVRHAEQKAFQRAWAAWQKHHGEAKQAMLEPWCC